MNEVLVAEGMPTSLSCPITATSPPPPAVNPWGDPIPSTFFLAFALSLVGALSLLGYRGNG